MDLGSGWAQAGPGLGQASEGRSRVRALRFPCTNDTSLLNRTLATGLVDEHQNSWPLVDSGPFHSQM